MKVITSLAGDLLKSTPLPVNLYQIHTKFRDEIRRSSAMQGVNSS